ncbi:aminotransferase-like domain-containing protein [Janthinobacterium agaricidamnosum]|uniref:Bacterial regulatory s, gntR family protein n=1 Tax=Janthinobacterium agaricidamnosum NBRC 102515 = DSM 9628 TaxID=1349767 RepID=W0UYC7_9BURK|nr:PLP-dependent aminotransferase family protein [Janthinobacterium agaricidamnosum]CDG81559.1 bacterial regulatory s, gntR family protein [Janthinobacterium agaricidamnosum NBRC 102515 = DSM 9628]
MITIDRCSALPLTDQIVEQFSTFVQQGVLGAGMRLPSIRRFAQNVGVSTYTAVIAYDRLVALGLVVSQASSGFFVARSQPRAPAARRDDDNTGASGELDAIWLTRSAAEIDEDWVAAGSGALPRSWLADVNSHSLVPRIWRSFGDRHSNVPAQGLSSLRAALAAYLGKENIFVDPAHIVTTAGATQALDLICRAVLTRGDCVVVENPTYPMLLSRLRQEGVKIIPIPRGPDGIDVAMLERVCAHTVPKLVFTQSALHNPTGFTSSLSNNHRLLSLAERFQFTIAEDDTYGDLAQGTPSRLAQLAGLHHVIYYRSFSKAMGTAVRVGFVAAAPGMTERLLEAKIHSVSNCSRIDESIVLELLQGGRYRKHTERLAQRLGLARVAAIKALDGLGLHVDPQADGLFLWTELAPGVAIAPLVRAAYREKILLAPGNIFSAAECDAGKDNYASYLRLNVAAARNIRLSDFLRAQCPTSPARQRHGAPDAMAMHLHVAQN